MVQAPLLSTMPSTGYFYFLYAHFNLKLTCAFNLLFPNTQKSNPPIKKQTDTNTAHNTWLSSFTRRAVIKSCSVFSAAPG